VKQKNQLLILLILGWLTLGIYPLFLPLPASAQTEPAIKLEMLQVGYDGAYQQGAWFPLTMLASNEGPDLHGVLEWQFLNGDDNTKFQREIELPRGSQKRLTLNVITNSSVQRGEIRLVVGKEIFLKQTVRLKSIDSNQLLVGVVSNDQGLLNSLRSIKQIELGLDNKGFNSTYEISFIALDSTTFPGNLTLLNSLDLIFLHDLASANFNELQRKAIESWTRLGGQLVISGGPSAEQMPEAWRNLLPVKLVGLEKKASLSSLTEIAQDPKDDKAKKPSPLALTTTINKVSLLPDAQSFDKANLLTEIAFREGRVIFLAFDISVLSGWSSESVFWANILKDKAGDSKRFSKLQRDSRVLTNALQLPKLRLPSLGIFVIFIFSYIFVIGPLNFGVLRRLRRTEWAWLTTPAIVLLFVGGMYLTGFLVRGIRPEIVRVSLIRGFEGQEEGYTTTFLGLFSPFRSTYTLGLPPEVQVTRLSDQFGNNNLQKTSILSTDKNTEVQNILLDVADLRSFVVEKPLTLAPQIKSNLQADFLELENVGQKPLENALIVSKGKVEKLKALLPGEKEQLDLQTAFLVKDFPGNAQAKTKGIINQQTLLNTLFNDFNGRAWVQAPNSFYLLTWDEQPFFEVQVNGQTVAQKGITLSVIRLKPR
jgi:hypothetical protein